jgi:hypothetical protein
MQGFESGVIIAFDKYMLPEYINTQNITVTQNEARINGSIEFIDEEANPKDPAEKYVSKLRFVPQVPFTVGDTLTVKVSYDVKSYAGLNMASDHIQKVIVEPELKSIIATENLKIDYTKTGRIEVSVLPKEVASGRKIFMKSNSPMIASVTDSVLLDTNGTATIDVKAELPGSANINITVERSSLKAEVAIEINMPAINQVKLGDSNEDGIVDEDDIINLINYIQAKNPNPFNFEASDINLNNTIDIADVVGIVSIIKNVTPPSVEINNGTLRLGNGLITMETSTPIGGFDFACNGDLKEMPDLKDYTVVRFMKDGNNRVLAYTMGQGISSGTLFTYNNQPTLSNLLFVDQIGNPVEMKLIFKSDIELNFNQGWNIFSINRLPANTDMKVLFQPLISADKLVKMQDENGNGFEVFGVFGGWTNNIGDISLTEGYKIKVNGNCNIVIDGASVVLPYNIPLKIGWNIISFPKQSVANGMAVVQQLIDRGTLIKVQGESGYSIENWGIFGGWQNTIGDFVPGEGYKIKVSKNDTLRIYDSYPKSSTELPDQNAVIHFSPEFEGNGIDHMNINLIGLLVNDFKAGDELAVFDGKTCVGAISVQQHHISDGFISIPVSAKDEYGDVGFTEGNPYRLKLWKKQSQAEYLIEDEIITGSSSFLKHESTFTSIKKLIVTGSDDYNLNGNSSVKCYPNPFKEGIIIETNLIDPEMMQIDVINQSGQLIKKILTITSLDPGIYFFNWDGRNEFGNNVPAGIYNLVMTDKSRKQYFKVLKIE